MKRARVPVSTRVPRFSVSPKQPFLVYDGGVCLYLQRKVREHEDALASAPQDKSVPLADTRDARGTQNAKRGVGRKL